MATILENREGKEEDEESELDKKEGLAKYLKAW